MDYRTHTYRVTRHRVADREKVDSSTLTLPVERGRIRRQPSSGTHYWPCDNALNHQSWSCSCEALEQIHPPWRDVAVVDADAAAAVGGGGDAAVVAVDAGVGLAAEA